MKLEHPVLLYMPALGSNLKYTSEAMLEESK